MSDLANTPVVQVVTLAATGVHGQQAREIRDRIAELPTTATGESATTVCSACGDRPNCSHCPSSAAAGNGSSSGNPGSTSSSGSDASGSGSGAGSGAGDVPAAGTAVDALAAQKAQLSDAVHARAAAISIQGSPEYQSHSRRGPVLTGVMDPQTGDIFWGQNQDAVPSDLHPLLRARLDDYLTATSGDTPERAGIPGAHSEIVALSQALNARQTRTGIPVTEADLPGFLLSNRSLIGKKRVIGIPPRCPNCFELTKGVTVVGGN